MLLASYREHSRTEEPDVIPEMTHCFLWASSVLRTSVQRASKAPKEFVKFLGLPPAKLQHMAAGFAEDGRGMDTDMGQSIDRADRRFGSPGTPAGPGSRCAARTHLVGRSHRIAHVACSAGRECVT